MRRGFLPRDVFLAVVVAPVKRQRNIRVPFNPQPMPVFVVVAGGAERDDVGCLVSSTGTSILNVVSMPPLRKTSSFRVTPSPTRTTNPFVAGIDGFPSSAANRSSINLSLFLTVIARLSLVLEVGAGPRIWKTHLMPLQLLLHPPREAIPDKRKI